MGSVPRFGTLPGKLLIELGEDVDCEARDYRSVEVKGCRFMWPIHVALVFNAPLKLTAWQSN